MAEEIGAEGREEGGQDAGAHGADSPGARRRGAEGHRRRREDDHEREGEREEREGGREKTKRRRKRERWWTDNRYRRIGRPNFYDLFFQVNVSVAIFTFLTYEHLQEYRTFNGTR